MHRGIKGGGLFIAGLLTGSIFVALTLPDLMGWDDAASFKADDWHQHLVEQIRANNAGQPANVLTQADLEEQDHAAHHKWSEFTAAFQLSDSGPLYCRASFTRDSLLLRLVKKPSRRWSDSTELAMLVMDHDTSRVSLLIQDPVALGEALDQLDSTFLQGVVENAMQNEKLTTPYGDVYTIGEPVYQGE
jgi:hypothetical protein